MQAASKLKWRILVVDDEPAVGNVIELMLRFEGHDVQSVTSGRSALTLLEQTAFDIIILDYAMPDMKGDELAAIIKQNRPTQSIIMLSAHAEMIRRSDREKRVVDAFVNKPFLLEDLRLAIVNSRATA